MDVNMNPLKITPEQFEIAVRNHIIDKGENLAGFIVEHLETIEGSDGDYEIDVIARFNIFGGAEITVLIECKHYSTRAVDRDKVMILNQKLQSTGAHKGMIFTTNKFQKGAIEFAQEHGISLVKLDWNEATYYVKSLLVNTYEVSFDRDGETYYEIICKGNAIIR